MLLILLIILALLISGIVALTQKKKKVIPQKRIIPDSILREMHGLAGCEICGISPLLELPQELDIDKGQFFQSTESGKFVYVRTKDGRQIQSKTLFSPDEISDIEKMWGGKLDSTLVHDTIFKAIEKSNIKIPDPEFSPY